MAEIIFFMGDTAKISWQCAEVKPKKHSIKNWKVGNKNHTTCIKIARSCVYVLLTICVLATRYRFSTSARRLRKHPRAALMKSHTHTRKSTTKTHPARATPRAKKKHSWPDKHTHAAPRAALNTLVARARLQSAPRPRKAS